LHQRKEEGVLLQRAAQCCLVGSSGMPGLTEKKIISTGKYGDTDLSITLVQGSHLVENFIIHS
jgi:hypothetical protein